MPAAAALLAFAAGSLVAVQARVNGELGTRLHDPVLAALVSNVGGWLLLAVLVLARSRWRRPLLRPPRPVRWWFYAGGAAGALLVAVNAAAAPVLGVALLTVGSVAGQTSGSLVVDRAGFGPAGHQPVTPRRVAGAALALTAVGAAAVGRHGHADVPLLAATVLAGLTVAVQLAVNGRLRVATGESMTTAAVNFTTGTALLGLGAGVLLAVGRLPAAAWPHQPGLYVGGALGATFVALAAWLVHPLGVLRLALLTIAGQLAGAALLDLVVPPAGGGLRAGTLAAAALTLVAVRVAGGQRRAGRSPGP